MRPGGVSLRFGKLLPVQPADAKRGRDRIRPEFFRFEESKNYLESVHPGSSEQFEEKRGGGAPSISRTEPAEIWLTADDDSVFINITKSIRFVYLQITPKHNGTDRGPYKCYE